MLVYGPSLVTCTAMLLRSLHLLLLAPLASSIAVPDCVRPAPSPRLLPTIADCDKVLRFIVITARMQRNIPLIWSRHPPALAARKLPAYFSYNADNDCEFVVDVNGDSEAEDVFPLGDVAFIGRDIILTCLVGEASAVDTLGSNAVGPKEVMRVTLRKKQKPGPPLQLLNGTLIEFNASTTA